MYIENIIRSDGTHLNACLNVSAIHKHWAPQDLYNCGIEGTVFWRPIDVFEETDLLDTKIGGTPLSHKPIRIANHFYTYQLQDSYIENLTVNCSSIL